MHYVAVATYLLAIATANIIVQQFGAWTMPLNAFLLIGLDLSLRDYLHDRWQDSLLWKMGMLIGGGALLTWLVQPEASWIAVASVVAFSGGAIGDTITYHWLREKRYLWRANGSNVIGAALDSILFPTIAFMSVMPSATIGQFFAKVFGGAVWAWIIEKLRLRYAVATLLIAGVTIPVQGQDLYLSTHYDTRRQQPIVAAVHDTPLPGKFFATGFVEVWRNPKNGFPAEEWTMFSKHWITRPLTKSVSVSVGIEALVNRPGVAFQWPQEAIFRPGDRSLYITPKIGLTYQVY